MKNAINSTLAALILGSTVLGGASAAFADSYYQGASATPIERVVVPRIGATVVAADVQTGGEGDYFVGIDRSPIDRISTGSISNRAAGNSTPVGHGEGDYYQGLNRN